MLNKRKRILNDPTRINNYNKFLSTLDHKSEHITPIESKNESTNLEENMKRVIDKIISDLDLDLTKNNYLSKNFTGQTPNDAISYNNPNDYQDISNKKRVFDNMKKIITKLHHSNGDSCCKYPIEIKDTRNHNYKNLKILKPPEPPVEIKETIHIETEINDISDIIKLTETYKADPSIKYNINMKALHNIKEPLEELNNMIGMKDLKNNIVDQILYFAQELHKDKNSTGDFMHTVIYGPPGTGKTEIAKMMGKIYSKLGILSKGTFKKVTRGDLVAGYLGQTALKTKDVIKEAIGGVLFIDEAYALGNSEKRDSFAKECIDTLCEALSDNKNDLMVIIAGYENELKECFFDYNQGLDSRFTWRFKTDEYNHEDLHKIFIKKVKDISWEIEENSITSEWFRKNKDYFKFFGRDIETILAKTKIAHGRRVFCKLENEKRKINLKDLDNGFKTYLKNEDVKNRKNDIQFKKELYNTLYS
jgi:SpoVK/Ycf46/Vps4 family AAA+-type ATPase